MDVAERLATKYAADYPGETARRLDLVPSRQVAPFLAALDPEIAAGVIESMLPARAAAAFEQMEEDKLSGLLSQVQTARSVLVLRAVTRAHRARIVSLIPERTRPVVERLLEAPQGSAGELAEPLQGVLSPAMSIATARCIVRDLSGPYAYVVDDGHCLVGVLHRKEIEGSSERALVENLMTRDVVRVPAAAPLAAVRRHPAWCQHDSLPVVDTGGVLVGCLSHRSLRRRASSGSPALSGRRPALAVFLELGELYWGGLTSMVSWTAGRSGQDEVKEVHGGS